MTLPDYGFKLNPFYLTPDKRLLVFGKQVQFNI